GLGNWSRLRHGCGWHRRAHGTGPPSLQEGDLRRLRGPPGTGEVGKKKWRGHVADAVARLIAALEPDDVVLGGGNVKKLKELPRECRAGDNANAFLGGCRLWGRPGDRIFPAAANTRS